MLFRSENDYGNMVAEDQGNSYGKCKQIALVSVEIEKNIRILSERELRDEIVVKEVLQKSFEGKNEISAMADGYSLDRLTNKIMELIREMYL